MVEFICVGKIIGTHGLKGNLKIVFNIFHFSAIFPFIHDENKNLLNGNYVRFLKGNVHLISISDVNNIDDAEKWKNSNLFIDPDNIDEKNDAFLEIHGKNLDIINIEGVILGKMNGLDNFGGGELIRITEHNADEFLPIHCVKKVDLETKKIIVEEIECE